MPLIQFADRVSSLSSTGLDSFGIEGLRPSDSLIERLSGFDEIISWYGANRPEFRSALSRLCRRCVFFQGTARNRDSEHATDFYARQVGAPFGLIPSIRTDQVKWTRKSS